jgi:hypothetical protein
MRRIMPADAFAASGVSRSVILIFCSSFMVYPCIAAAVWFA